MLRNDDLNEFFAFVMHRCYRDVKLDITDDRVNPLYGQKVSTLINNRKCYGVATSYGDKHAYTIVCWVKDIPAGYLSFTEMRKRSYIELESLCVSTSFERRGIGTLLVMALILFAGRFKYPLIGAFAEPSSQGLLARIGFNGDLNADDAAYMTYDVGNTNKLADRFEQCDALRGDLRSALLHAANGRHRKRYQH